MLEASCQVFQCLRLLGKSKELQNYNSKQGAGNCLKDMQIYTDTSRTKSGRSPKFCSLKSSDNDLHLLSLQKQTRPCPFKTCHRVGSAIPMCCGWSSSDCRYLGSKIWELFSHFFLPPVFISNLQPFYGGREGNLSSPGGLRTGLRRASLKGNLPKCVDVRDAAGEEDPPLGLQLHSCTRVTVHFQLLPASWPVSSVINQSRRALTLNRQSYRH